MTLQPFNPKAKCPKCGHDQVGTWYCEGKDPWKKICHDKRLGGHLHRHCDRCHFPWLESCVNEVKIDV